MKEALVSPDLLVKIVDSPIPEPKAGEVLIKVNCAGTNPKDWKSPSRTNTTSNSGDDVAGEIAKIGDAVFEFRPGDRVAAMHVMRTPSGAFAEYAIAPASTTFHLPQNVSYEEAATIPLAALTAVVGLYRNLKIPAPWERNKSKVPLLIWGGSSAVGAFAIKLALRSNVHPIVAIAGKSCAFVEGLLDKSQGDAVIDYRGGEESVIKGIQQALQAANAGPAQLAFDTISEKGSFQTLAKVLDPKGHITLILPDGDYTSIPQTITTSLTWVGVVHTDAPYRTALKGIRHVEEGDGKGLGFVYSRLFGRGLQEGWFTGHPQEIVPGGLNGLSTALGNLRDGKANAIKYVMKIGETK